MLKIRLQRIGRKKIPAFRLVVAEHTMPIQGRFIEKLGNFIAGRKEDTIKLNTERIKHWFSVGAKPSQTVARLLTTQGIKEAEKFIEERKNKPKKKDVEEKKDNVVKTDEKEKKDK